MNRSKVIDKIRKLLALGTSNNPNEAAMALEKAAKLMNEHQVTEADIAISNIKEKQGRGMNCKTPPSYLVILAGVVSDLFQCDHYYMTSSSLVSVWDNSKYEFRLVRKYKTAPVFVGFNLSEELASYTYDVLSRKLEKARRNYKVNAWSRAEVVKVKDNYCLGWVEAIRRKIVDMIPPKPEIEIETESGLVKVDALAHYVEQNVKSSFSARESSISEKDLMNGFYDGEKETINKAMANNNLLRLS